MILFDIWCKITDDPAGFRQDLFECAYDGQCDLESAFFQACLMLLFAKESKKEC